MPLTAALLPNTPPTLNEGGPPPRMAPFPRDEPEAEATLLERGRII